jgi:hypothetical protein
VHGCYDFELGDDGRIADVAGVQDLIDALERGVDLCEPNR